MNYFTKSVSASLVVATTLVAAGINTASAQDKFLKSLEDRIAALEAEVNATSSDAKGKGEITSPKIPVYVQPKSKYVTEIKLRGRIQWQFGYSWGAGYQGGAHNSYSTQEIRRARIGVEGKLMNDFRFMIEADVLPGAAALNSAYIQWTAMEYFQPLVGYVKPRFGYEENTSSAKILTVERSRITNAFATSYITGAVIEGAYSFFNYSFGIFNAVPNGTAINGVGFNNQNYLYNASIGFDFSEMVGMPLEFRADYMNFDTDPTIAGNQMNRLNLKQNINLSLRTGYGPFDLRAEWYYGFDSNGQQANLNKQAGSNKEYVWAFSVMPSIYIIPDKLQFVTRYEMGDAGFTTAGINQPFGTRVRYERFLNGAGAGALHYWAIYSGLNYYINGDDLKLMVGHYYSEQKGNPLGGKGNNRHANTIYTAVRMQF